MRYNIYFQIERIIRKLESIYTKQVFLAKINSKQNDVKVLGKVYVWATNVKIGRNVTIYPGVTFWGDGEIIIGDNVDIGKDTIIYSKKKVSIGNNVAIAAQCYIIDSNHGTRYGVLIRDQKMVTESICIEDDVWIAAGCKILKGSHIRYGAVIGAMSLVNSEIEQNSIAVGIPAKVIKKRTL